jgi:hypothetical protein
MMRISLTGWFPRPGRTGNAGLQILGVFGAVAIVAASAVFTSAQAQYRGGYYGGGYYGGGYGYGHRYGGYRPSYAGYFGPGQLGPEFGPGYYEVSILPTTYYDLPPYEEPGFNGYGGGYGGVVSYCSARFQSYNPYTGLYLGYDGFPHSCP